MAEDNGRLEDKVCIPVSRNAPKIDPQDLVQ